MTAGRRLPTQHRRSVPPGHCRWCGEVIDKVKHPRARTWHPACVEEYRRQEPGHQRAMVRQRDHGRCAACGQTEQGGRARTQHQTGWRYWEAIARLPGIPCPNEAGRWRGPEVLAAEATAEAMNTWLDAYWEIARRAKELDREAQAGRTMPLQWELLRAPWRARPHPWEGVEYDHVEPLWAGGANTVENLQTLCVPCHRAKTAREAAERARLRREACRAAAPQMTLAEA